MNEKLHIGYVRVSTDEQAQSGYSIDFQRARLEDRFKKMGIDDYLIFEVVYESNNERENNWSFNINPNILNII